MGSFFHMSEQACVRDQAYLLKECIVSTRRPTHMCSEPSLCHAGALILRSPLHGNILSR